MTLGILENADVKVGGDFRVIGDDASGGETGEVLFYAFAKGFITGGDK